MRSDRLVIAAAQQISERGLDGASARAVATAAGVSASAINYNFGGLERLFSLAFDRGVDLAADWLEPRRAALKTLPKGPDAAAFVIEWLVGEWTSDARQLALLYQEHLAGRSDAAWQRLWRGFWLEAAATLGLSETDGALMHVLFESEALYHLSGWAPLLESAALRELCGHFGAVWLGARRSPAMGALTLAETVAGARPVWSVSAMEAKLAEAAAQVVETRGLGGLTHRAVAAQAKVTTGAVTHYFRTVESLVAAAVRGQILAMAPPEEAVRAPPLVGSVQELFEAIRLNSAAPPPTDPALRRRRLFLASLRRSDLSAAGAVIRFAHGGTFRESLQNLPEAERSSFASLDLALDPGLASRLLASLRVACLADPEPLAAQAALADEIVRRLEESWRKPA